MFGKNEIIGQKFFKDVEPNKLFVTSMFMTLQGEGPFRGEPAFFIRLAKCNLACSFCDTFFDDGDWLTVDEIEQKIEETIDAFYKSKNIERPDWTKHQFSFGFTIHGQDEYGTLTYDNKEVGKYKRDDPYINTLFETKGHRYRKKMVLVVTGGEPSLQYNLTSFLERMTGIFEDTQIESNGTVYRELPYFTTLVVSPKCAEKNGVAVRYLKPNKEVLERANCLKFVMSADKDSPYNSIPDWAHEWAKEHPDKQIFISPMNIYNTQPQKSKQLRAESNQIDLETRSTVDEKVDFWEPGLLNMEQNERNHKYAAEYCMMHGFVFNVQIHLLAGLA